MSLLRHMLRLAKEDGLALNAIVESVEDLAFQLTDRPPAHVMGCGLTRHSGRCCAYVLAGLPAWEVKRILLQTKRKVPVGLPFAYHLSEQLRAVGVTKDDKLVIATPELLVCGIPSGPFDKVSPFPHYMQRVWMYTEN